MMTDDVKHPGAILDLATTDADAFPVLGAVSRALHTAGAPRTDIDEFQRQAMAGDYDNLLRVTMSWVTVTDSRGLSI